MKKCLWLNYLLICIFFGLFTACSDDENDENGSGGDSGISDKEIVVKITLETSGDIELGLDGEWIGEVLSHDDKREYTSSFLTDYKTIAFPKDLTVNWGDGTETSSTTHEYTSKGTYQITLKCKGLRSLYIDSDYSGNIKAVDLSKAVDLEYLGFEGGSMGNLDIKENKKLKFLSYPDANGSFVDVSNNTKLMYLDCNYYKGEIGDLNFSKNTELRYLSFDCEGNFNEPTSLNIKGCNELIYLGTTKVVFNDEMANKVYNDLPQGKTWKYRDKEYSSYVDVGANWVNGKYEPVGNFSIAKQKGWKVYNN